ncbi:hypothetical protein ACQCX2_17485 [Propionibacteriaceae bacterium Y1700]|uniref:hypothetical protein n=1 Tax=Microlunatus sp. Y1700 TaxID=3418487 RepID=UPI003DA70198
MTIHTDSVPPLRTTSTPPPPRSRLTIAAGWALLAICVLHTVVFAANPFWGEWLAGPLRDTPLSADAATTFWALPASFVALGVMLSILIIDRGRRGDTFGLWLPLSMLGWAAVCLWIIGGPGGFALLVVPATLLIMARLIMARLTRRARRTRA